MCEIPDRKHIGNYLPLVPCLLIVSNLLVDTLVLHWAKLAPHQTFVLDLSAFWPQYHAWWATSHREATLGLTILILRVISCALYFSTGTLSIEPNSTQFLVGLAHRIHAAADKLAASVLSQNRCIMQVEQLSLIAISLQLAPLANKCISLAVRAYDGRWLGHYRT